MRVAMRVAMTMVYALFFHHLDRTVSHICVRAIRCFGGPNVARSLKNSSDSKLEESSLTASVSSAEKMASTAASIVLPCSFFVGDV